MQNLRASQRDADKTGDSSLPSKTLKFLAVLIIFFSCTQLGLHFWPLSSLVYGIRIDYLSPTLYFLDVLILLYLGLELGLKFRSFSGLQQSVRQIGTSAMGMILPILLTNLLFSQNPLATLNWSLHLLLYSSFIFSLKTDILKFIPKILLVSLVFQLGLGLAQFYLGHSVGGLMYYLGERMVAVGSPGIATTSLMGQVVLRAYGTFSHPNILAGWSVVALLVLRRLLDRKPGRMPSWDTEGGRSLLMGTICTTLIIFLTNSRSGAIALFGLVIPFHLLQKTKTRIIYFSIFICSLFFVLQSSSLPRSDLSISERLDLQGVSLQAISHFPIFGAGGQASISTYPSVSPLTRLLQPDHNSFTLFLSWFGLLGLIAIVYSLSSFDIRHSLFSVLPLLPLLPLLLLDHYLLTSPQGLFFFLLYLAVAVNYTHAQKDRK